MARSVWLWLCGIRSAWTNLGAGGLGSAAEAGFRFVPPTPRLSVSLHSLGRAGGFVGQHWEGRPVGTLLQPLLICCPLNWGWEDFNTEICGTEVMRMQNVQGARKCMLSVSLQAGQGTDRDDEECSHALKEAGVVHNADAALHYFPFSGRLGPGYCNLGKKRELID